MSTRMTYVRFMGGARQNGPTAFVRSLVMHEPVRVPPSMNPDSVSKISRDVQRRTLVRFIDGEWWACRVGDDE